MHRVKVCSFAFMCAYNTWHPITANLKSDANIEGGSDGANGLSCHGLFCTPIFRSALTLISSSHCVHSSDLTAIWCLSLSDGCPLSGRNLAISVSSQTGINDPTAADFSSNAHRFTATKGPSDPIYQRNLVPPTTTLRVAGVAPEIGDGDLEDFFSKNGKPNRENPAYFLSNQWDVASYPSQVNAGLYNACPRTLKHRKPLS